MGDTGMTENVTSYVLLVVFILSFIPLQVIPLKIPDVVTSFHYNSRVRYCKDIRRSVSVVKAASPVNKKTDLSNVDITNRAPRHTKNQHLRGKRKDDISNRSHSEKSDRGCSIRPKANPDIKSQLQYSRNGHAVLRQLLPIVPLQQLRALLYKYGQEQELEAWRQKVYVAADSDPVGAAKLVASCHSVADCQNELRRLLRSNEHVPLPFLQYFNTWRSYTAVYDVAKSLSEIAAIFMDVPSVRLYQDAVFWKRTGDGPTPWHTDARMAPFDTSHMITIWIPLQPVHHSGLIFCSKSHSDFALPYWNDVVAGEADKDSPWNKLEERYPSSQSCWDYMPLALGDVTVHSGWTLHCADAVPPLGTRANTQQEDRIALAITYVDAFAPIRNRDTHLSPKSDLEDLWSYKDWINDVPCNTRHWNHPRVPILWPDPSSFSYVAKSKRK
jgi:ectoine hydroxylase-related dioxygenase (phytanoyl-CoA dioxygenase family)